MYYQHLGPIPMKVWLVLAHSNTGFRHKYTIKGVRARDELDAVAKATDVLAVHGMDATHLTFEVRPVDAVAFDSLHIVGLRNAERHRTVWKSKGWWSWSAH